ncbi:MAG: hypothetical protein PHG97_07430 [Candidatus Margulisbacteria bacterium]|nr:hypothetical protein [Candidatus Margulisiibacteriota bacterium]
MDGVKRCPPVKTGSVIGRGLSIRVYPNVAKVVYELDKLRGIDLRPEVAAKLYEDKWSMGDQERELGTSAELDRSAVARLKDELGIKMPLEILEQLFPKVKPHDLALALADFMDLKITDVQRKLLSGEIKLPK